MALDESEINGLKDILKEFTENVETYKKLKETGNSKGEHKDIYRGKFEAYNRAKTLLLRYMRWNSIIKI